MFANIYFIVQAAQNRNLVYIEVPVGVQVRLWSEVLQSVVEDTKGHVEKKQASTYEEILAEQEQKAEEVRTAGLACWDFCPDHTGCCAALMQHRCLACPIGLVMCVVFVGKPPWTSHHT